MKILILGANGMLGHALQGVFHGAVAWDLPEIDITDEQAVRERLGDLKPGIVINAAAYTDVDKAEENEDFATRINGGAVEYLADVCLAMDSVLIHYSTDYVFNGTNSDGYLEDDIAKNPVNAYGRSKLVGEQIINTKIQEGLRGYIVRTSWLYGAHGKNFVDTMVRLGQEKEELRVVNNQHGKPTYTVDLANTTKELLDDRIAPGIYHATNETSSGGITWFDFAKEIIALSGGVAEVKPCPSSDYQLPAKRPHYSMLRNTKLLARRRWRVALEEYLM